MLIDINSDMGEGFGPYHSCDDAALMRLVSSANIACGFHAGDPDIMARMVNLARKHDVAIGAHPGYPDLQGFGRRDIAFGDETIYHQILYQYGALRTMAQAQNVHVEHISFHAALGSALNRKPALSARLMQDLKTLDPNLIVFAMEETVIAQAAKNAGLAVLFLFLADRAYDRQGNLVPRGLEGAVIHEESKLRARVRRFLETSTVETIEGEIRPLTAQSILVHSDTPGALELAGIIRDEALQSGATIAPARKVLNQ